MYSAMSVCQSSSYYSFRLGRQCLPVCLSRSEHLMYWFNVCTCPGLLHITGRACVGRLSAPCRPVVWAKMSFISRQEWWR